MFGLTTKRVHCVLYSSIRSFQGGRINWKWEIVLSYKFICILVKNQAVFSILPQNYTVNSQPINKGLKVEKKSGKKHTTKCIQHL